jgi:hypothetical protein
MDNDQLIIGMNVWTCVPTIESESYGEQYTEPRMLMITEILSGSTVKLSACDEDGNPSTDTNSIVYTNAKEVFRTEIGAWGRYERLLDVDQLRLNACRDDMLKRLKVLRDTNN